MDTALKELGLNEKETKFYVYLLKNGEKTGAELSEELNENRTNVYMVVNKLVEQGMVESDDSQPVRRYRITNPNNLKNVVMQKQQEVKRAQLSLSNAMSEMTSLFNLSQHKPGVVHLEGIGGYRSFQEDIGRVGHDICIFASDVVPKNQQALEVLRQAESNWTPKFKKRRMIFHEQAREYIDTKMFAKKGYEIGFWGKAPLEGEIEIYGNKVAFITYQPKLIITVITNDIIATTLRTIFDQVWSNAKG